MEKSKAIKLTTEQLKTLYHDAEVREAVTKFYDMPVMFSNSASLMAYGPSDGGDGQYWIVNGEWEGTRKGNKFIIAGDEDDTLNIEDWAQMTYGDFTSDERKMWYLPEHPPTHKEVINRKQWECMMEDDIPF